MKSRETSDKRPRNNKHLAKSFTQRKRRRMSVGESQQTKQGGHSVLQGLLDDEIKQDLLVLKNYLANNPQYFNAAKAFLLECYQQRRIQKITLPHNSDTRTNCVWDIDPLKLTSLGTKFIKLSQPLRNSIISLLFHKQTMPYNILLLYHN